MPDKSVDGTSDSDLLVAARKGHPGAFGELVRRHSGAAFRAAVRYGSGVVDPDDLAAEAFVRVWLVLRQGSGPTGGLRSYLVVLVRNLAMRRWFQEIRGTRAGEMVARRCKYQMVSAAFHTLPAHARELLWALDVDGVTPADRIRRTAVARARAELRGAVLRTMVPDGTEPGCRTTRAVLVACVRGEVSVRRAKLFTAHLDECASCRTVAAGLVETSCELALTGSIARWLPATA